MRDCLWLQNDQPTIVTDTGSMLIMEAGGSYGQAAAKTYGLLTFLLTSCSMFAQFRSIWAHFLFILEDSAMEAAVERAKTHGICMLGLRNANHIGRVGTCNFTSNPPPPLLVISGSVFGRIACD